MIEESFVGAVAEPYSPNPIVDGEVKVYFDNGTDDTMIAIYHGPGLADPTGLCPGNSLFSGSFQFVSNAPITDGACEGFTTDVGSVRLCSGNVWLYRTNIPNDSVGDLYGSVEILTDAGFEGLTAVATNTPGTPPIDYSADVYTIPAMFTSDGSTQISCDKPLT